MAKTYKVKWYDWNAGHYKEKECTSEQLNPLFLKIKRKSGNFRYYNSWGEHYWIIQMTLNNNIAPSVKYIKSLKKTIIIIGVWNAETIH